MATQKHHHTGYHNATKLLIALVISVFLLAATPLVAAEGTPDHDLTNANVQVTKYACPHDTTITDDHMVDEEGTINSPEECYLQPGSFIGYVAEENQPTGDTGSPWETQGPADVISTTDENGRILFENLNDTHRYGIIEVDENGDALSENEVLFFECTDDGGKSTDQYEFVFPQANTTKYCVAYNYEPQGSINITKYTCPHDTQVTRNDNAPDQTGAHAAPEACERTEGVDFGTWHDPENTGTSGPFKGINQDTGWVYGATTQADGTTQINELSTIGRQGVAELDESGTPISDEEVLGFFCYQDPGTYTDNWDMAFVPEDNTTHCVMYNEQEAPVCEEFHEASGTKSITRNSFDIDITYDSTQDGVSLAVEFDPALTDKKDREYVIVAFDSNNDGQANFRLAWTAKEGRFAPDEWGSYQEASNGSWGDWVVRPNDIDFEYNNDPYNYFNWSVPASYFDTCGTFGFAVYGVTGRNNHFVFPDDVDKSQTEENTSSENYYFVPKHEQQEPLTCVQAIKQDLIGYEWDATAGTATVTNNGYENYTFSLASYEKHDLNATIPNNQTLFDSETATLMPGENYTFSVDNPSCAYQIDLVCGEPIENLSTSNMYNDRKLAYAHPNNQAGACVDEPHEEINFCEQGVMHLDTSGDEQAILSRVNTSTSTTSELVTYNEELRSSVAVRKDGVLFGLRPDGGNTGDLVILEDDGSITTVGDTEIRNNAVAMEFAPNGKLYVANQPRSEIFEINTSTGQATLLMTFDEGISGGDIVFNEYSELFYVKKTGDVYSIDLVDESYELVGSLPASFITSAAYYNNAFYALDESTNELFSFTTNPFTYESVGSAGEFGFGDATACPVDPEEKPVCEEFEEASGTIQTSSGLHDIDISYDSTRDGVDIVVEFSPELSDKKNEEWLTLAVDSDNDGVADFRLGWTAQQGYFAPGEWGSYQEVVNGSWGEWVKRPDNISFDYNNDPYDYFNWSIPAEFFDTCGPFRFAVNGYTGFSEFVFPGDVEFNDTSSEHYYVVPPGANDPEPVEGSLEVCKAIMHNESYLANWSDVPASEFSMGLFVDNESRNWSISSNETLKMIGYNGVDVYGHCSVVEEFADVTTPVKVEYGEESINNSFFGEPLYNSYFQAAVNSANFFAYGADERSDGSFYVTESYPHKKIFILNELVLNETSIPEDGNETDGNETTPGNETNGDGNETNGGNETDTVTTGGPSTFGSGGGGDGGLNSWLSRFAQEPVMEEEPETGSGSSPGVTVEPVDEPAPEQPPATEEPPVDNNGNLLTGAVVGGGAGNWLWALILAVLVGGGVWYATRP